jgi:antitoxin component YwqK of YwqJK toxin-antitoxin module
VKATFPMRVQGTSHARCAEPGCVRIFDAALSLGLRRAARLVVVGLVGAFLTVVAGCSKQIDAAQAQNIGGLIYKLHDNEPFSGTVINVSRFQVDALAGAGSTCALDMHDGKLDGQLTCKTDGGQQTIEQRWRQGQKNGAERVWETPSGRLHIGAEWKNGKLVGAYEVRNPTLDKLIEQRTYRGGELIQRKAWDPTGQHLLIDLTISNGQQTGVVKFGETETNWVDGKEHGIQRQYRANDARQDVISRVLAVDRLVEQLRGGANFAGLYLGYDLVTERMYNRGIEVSSKDLSAKRSEPVLPSNVSCVDKYAEVYRNEAGAGALVSADQAEEWARLCKATSSTPAK